MKRSREEILEAVQYFREMWHRHKKMMVEQDVPFYLMQPRVAPSHDLLDDVFELVVSVLDNDGGKDE